MADVPARVRSLAWPVDSARLTLRPPATRDLPELLPLVGDRRISDPTTIPHPYGPAEGRSFVRSAREKLRRGGGFDVLGFARSDGHLVGGLGLTLRSPDRRPPYAEIGYWVRVGDWGRGYASEMLQTGLVLGFHTIRLHRLEAWVKGYNDASYRVLTKAGFREEGRARESVFHGGRYHDRVLLGLLRGEYEAPHRRVRRRPGTPDPGT